MLARVAAVLAGFVVLADSQRSPHLGQPCHGCTCGDMDLSSYSGREFITPADDDGYVYMFRMCEEIPQSNLPEGCKNIPGEPDLPRSKRTPPWTAKWWARSDRAMASSVA